MIVHNLFVFFLLLALVFILGEVIVVTRQRDKLFPHQSVLQTTLPAWYVCADLCSRMKVCKSMNFISRTKTCQILDELPGTSQKCLKDSVGDTFLERSAIPDNLAGKCFDHKCNTKEICIEQKTGHTCTPIPLTSTALKPKHCSDLPACGKFRSGVYRIYPSGSGTTGFEVFCDIDTNEQGWTVFQNRVDKKVSFKRSWTEYEDGFGSSQGNYWMGNKRLHQITLSHVCSLKVVYHLYGQQFYSFYTNFKIGDASTRYEITKKHSSGYDILRQNGKMFTTTHNKPLGCYTTDEKGWWFNGYCLPETNLNAMKICINGMEYSVSSTKLMIHCSR